MATSNQLRRIRFSLHALLCAFVPLAIIFAVVARERAISVRHANGMRLLVSRGYKCESVERRSTMVYWVGLRVWSKRIDEVRAQQIHVREDEYDILRECELTHLLVIDCVLSNVRMREVIVKCPLEDIYLEGESIDDIVASGLTDKLDVKSVNLIDTSITDIGVRKLSCLGNASHIALCSKEIGDEAIKAIATNRNIDVLQLVNSGCTDRSIELLCGMERLAELDLRGSSISPEGQYRIRQALPRTVVLTDDY